MKLGSIVGLIVAGLLIIAGVITCMIGASKAEASGEFLFTQKNDDGTYYSQPISGETTKLSLGFNNADVIIRGGAEKSGIEFKNFNPNLYSISATRNVITFEELSDFKSVFNVWENGISFKGLRYLLDFRTYDYDYSKKSIVINVSDVSELKILSITAKNSTVTVENLKLPGDLFLSVGEGEINVTGLEASSTLSVTGKTLKTNIASTSAETLRCTGDSVELSVTESDFTEAQVSVISGRVDYYAVADMSAELVNITSESGGLLINSVPNTGVFEISNEEYEKSIKIVTTTAGVNFVYPVVEE